ncbi:unnamed protein product [Anisakis simplex]|uniref:Filamentous hemagglutinin n=1 Tax=Anisakis simplex TaxID=6269 RepID=A0A0M3JC04_ANISI|nr:unnamed protein product [Anisakis simplex]
MGSGQVQGTGSSASNTSLNTNTVYNNNGQASVQVSGKGDATGHNKTYAINIDTNGQLSNPNGVNNSENFLEYLTFLDEIVGNNYNTLKQLSFNYE